MASVCRTRIASMRRRLSDTKLCHYHSSSGASKCRQEIHTNNAQTFEDGKSFLHFHRHILSSKFYSTTAWPKFEPPQGTHELPGSSSESEDEEFQAQNDQKQEESVQEIVQRKNDQKQEATVQEMVEKSEAPDEIKRSLQDLGNCIRQIINKGEKDMEETLNEMDIRLTAELVRIVLSNISSPSSALRFFQWAKNQKGFNHNSITYDELTNIVGRSKEFETLQMLLAERGVTGCINSVRTFSFATVWHDDPAMLKEVTAMLNKLDNFSRRNAYDMLIAALCKENYVDAASSVLRDMLSVGCVPHICTFHPLIIAYSRNNQMAKVHALFEVMKVRDCSPDSTCYNFVLSSFCRRDEFAKAAELLGTMVNSAGCKPDRVTYDILVSGACKIGKMEGALQIFNRMKEEGLEPLYSTYRHIINGYLQAGELEKAHSFLNVESGKDHSLASRNYTFFIRSCIKMGKVVEARSVLMEMKAKDLNPDDQLCNEVLCENLFSQAT